MLDKANIQIFKIMDGTSFQSVFIVLVCVTGPRRVLYLDLQCLFVHRHIIDLYCHWLDHVHLCFARVTGCT